VVRGVAAFHQGGGGQQGRRPLRAGFEVVLTRQLGEVEERLMPAGHPLVAGWGVTAWHQPGDGTGPVLEWIVRSRLVSETVIEDLCEAKHLRRDGGTDEGISVLKWSRMFLTRFPYASPFSARLAFDFLSRKVELEINGSPYELPAQPVDVSGQLFGRYHPIHQLLENWFERRA